MSDEWDVVVVGGGAAGLSAAQMLGRSLRRTLVVGDGSPRNRFAAHMHGVLGHDGVDPAVLLDTGRIEARRYGVEIAQGAVAALADEGGRIRVTLADGREHCARLVVLASGVRDELPDVPGLREEWGRGVLHCPYCHGWEVARRRLGVLATSPASLHQVHLVRQLSSEVTVFTAAAEPLPEDAGVRLAARGVRRETAPVRAVRREGDRLVVVTEEGEHAVDALFTGGTPLVDLPFADGLRLARTDGPGSPLAVDATGRTSHPRVLAAGNVVSPYGNVPVSMASGSMAGAGANALLVAEDVDRAVAERAAARHAGWERRYAEREHIWSGGVNASVEQVVQRLRPGTALDVGSGEGGDAVWLATQGWRVTGVDVSASAVRRAAALAQERGVEAALLVGDGAAAVDRAYDLVLASFLHSWEEDFPRIRMLRDAADRVAPGGRLLVVSHAAPPPWAGEGGHHHPPLRSPSEELAVLDLDPAAWRTEIAEIRTRRAVGPDGRPADLDDGVLLLRRQVPEPRASSSAS